MPGGALGIGLALLLGAVAISPAAAEQARTIREGPLVAAAASMGPLMEALSERFEARYGEAPTMVLAASGHLSRQLSQGAPYEVFLSADSAWMTRAVESGAISADSVVSFAWARLVLVWADKAARGPVPAGSTGAAAGSLAGETELALLLNDSVRYVTLANPEIAPFGRAAESALRAANLWEPLNEKLVFAENVAQAWQYLTSGNADAGFVAGPLAVRGRLPWLAIRGDLYPPLVHTAGLSPEAGEGARAYLELLMSDEGQGLLAEFGYRPKNGVALPPAERRE